MSLYEVIVREMQSDDENPEKISKRIKDTYDRCNTAEQAIINDLFITLTGWSFETLLEKEKEENGNE
jgi:hypothetical protein